MADFHRKIVENIEDSFILLDKEGRIVKYTPDIGKIFGISNSKGKNIEEFDALKPEGIWQEETEASEILWEYKDKTEHLILRNISLEEGFLLCFRQAKEHYTIETKDFLNYSIENIPGVSQKIKEKAIKASKTKSPVLITGETGVGKEILSRAIHKESKRNGEFIPINCTAIPEDLVESELFGYEPGAFTGAKGGKLGKFQLADKGTIFLDEIADMPDRIQSKLLRVVEYKEVWRVGAQNPEKTNFRLISATNVDIKRLVEKGVFRQDLYHRIAPIVINLPPLRDRIEHFEDLVLHFLKKHDGEDLRFTNEVMAALKAYSWSGNIRELEQVIRFIIKECFHRGVVNIGDLPVKIKDSKNSDGRTLSEKLETKKKKEIKKALKVCNRNKKKAAEYLGISRKGLYQMMERLF